MKLVSVDRDGWLQIEETVTGAEGSHEWIDVMGGEYLFIDDVGFLYEPYESEEAYYGYKLRRTLTRRSEVLEVVKRYRDGERLSSEDLRVCRGDCPA